LTKVRKQPLYKKGTVYHPTHAHTDYMDYWLRNFMKDGSVLHLCCGTSNIGDVRVDLDPTMNTTMVGDLFKVIWEFREESFDYVYIDPPFDFYNPMKVAHPFEWQFRAFQLCKKALLTRRPRMSINMASRWHEWKVFEDSRPSVTLVRIDYK